MVREDLLETYILRAVDRDGDGKTSWSMNPSMVMSTRGSLNPDGSFNRDPPKVSNYGNNVAWLDTHSDTDFSSVARIGSDGKKIYVNTYGVIASPKEFFLGAEMELEKPGMQDLSLRNQYISEFEEEMPKAIYWANSYLPRLSQLILKATFSNDKVYNDNVQRWNSDTVNHFADPIDARIVKGHLPFYVRYIGSVGDDNLTMRGAPDDYRGTIIADAGDGDDTLVGTYRTDLFYGGDGDDILRSFMHVGTTSYGNRRVEQANDQSYYDILDGGAGNDTIYAEIGATVSGGTGVDFLYMNFDDSSSPVSLNLVKQLSGSNKIGDGTSISGIEGFQIGLSNGNDVVDARGFAPAAPRSGGGTFFTGNGGVDTLIVDHKTSTAITWRGFERGILDFSEATSAVNITGNTGVKLEGYTIRLSGISLTTGQSLQVANLTVTGTAFADSYVGSPGADTLKGGGGADTLTGGAGLDILDGGDGLDTALYTEKTTGVSVALNRAANSAVTIGGVREDVVRNVENLTGGSGNDTFLGDSAENILIGGGGNDRLRGGAGKDSLIGGAGNDTADFSDKTVSVVVTLGTGVVTAMVGGKAEDTLKEFENLTGGSGADVLTGDRSANVLFGGDGNDILTGGHGKDVLDGGVGIDTVDFTGQNDVKVTLAGNGTAVATIGGQIEDTLRNIENLVGSRYNDRLEGDGLVNILQGAGGNDVLKGAGGKDVLDGGDGRDTADFSDKTASIAVTLKGTANSRVTVGAAVEDIVRNIENVTGGQGADRLVGDAFNNVFDGGGGKDILTGGEGADTFVFSTPLVAASIDRITDFNSYDDDIDLSRTVASGAPTGYSSAAFFKNLDLGSVDADDRVLYDPSTGTLFYDRDGSGRSAATAFAILSPNTAINYTDFGFF